MYFAKSEKLWALVDCNNFYASCETLFRPDLRGKPIVVLSNNDGCIIARSNEAKKLGIKMGDVEFKVRSFLKANKVTVFSSNYTLYGDISARIMRILEKICPEIEQYSIDEAFIQLSSSLASNVNEITQTIRHTIRQWTGITVSIGVGKTKTLAKIANHIAKKANGIFILTQPEEITSILKKFPVEEVWGIGKRSADKLKNIGITNAWQLSQKDDIWLRRVLTVTGQRTAWELRGIPCLDESDIPIQRKTLVSSRSFGSKITDKSILKNAIAHFTANGAARLRREGLYTAGIAVYIRTSPHVFGKQHEATAQHVFHTPTANTNILQKTALKILENIFQQGPAYAKAGIMFFDLSHDYQQQISLLPSDTGDEQSNKALMSAIDNINRKFGRHTVKFGAEGLNDSAWGMHQKHLSPKYTTDWKDLAIASCR